MVEAVAACLHRGVDEEEENRDCGRCCCWWWRLLWFLSFLLAVTAAALQAWRVDDDAYGLCTLLTAECGVVGGAGIVDVDDESSFAAAIFLKKSSWEDTSTTTAFLLEVDANAGVDDSNVLLQLSLVVEEEADDMRRFEWTFVAIIVVDDDDDADSAFRFFVAVAGAAVSGEKFKALSSSSFDEA